MGHRDQLIGSTLAGYRIESLIGRGGMGAVYLAEQVTLGRHVALKVLSPDLGASADFRHRFERESRVAASLDHPHVVPIFESGQADGLLFIAMRFVEGTDLATLIAAEGALELGRAAAFVGQVGSALDAAHAKGLVHRDVKPGNVLIARGADGEEDYAYLSDFGLTRLTHSDSALTRTGQFMGTVAYAAPEQFEGKTADAASDLYSLGCVAFECLTGQRPFPREQEAAVMFAHLQEPPPMVTANRPGAPGALDPILAKAMAKAPADRYGSGRELATAVRSVVAEAIGAGSLPGGASSSSLGEGSEPAPSIPSTPPIPIRAPTGQAGPGAQPRGHRRGWLAAALVALALVAASVVVIAVNGGPSGHGAPRSSQSAGPSASTGSSPTASPSSPDSLTGLGPPPGLSVTEDSVAQLDPETGEVLATFEMGSSPQDLAFSGHAVWVRNAGDSTISKVDAASGHVTTRGGVPTPCGLQSGPHGGIWVNSCSTDEELLVDPSFEITRSLHVPGPAGVVTTAGSTWAVSYRGQGTNSYLLRFTPSGHLQDQIELGPESWDVVVTDDGSLWGNDAGDGTIWRVDPTTNEVEFVPGWTSPDGIVAADGELWISDGQLDSVTEWDPISRHTIGVIQGHSGAMVVDTDAVWILDGFSDVLTKVDQDDGQVLAEFELPYASDLVAGDGSLWISASAD
jgi:serine/threonine-protein kinase